MDDSAPYQGPERRGVSPLKSTPSNTDDNEVADDQDQYEVPAQSVEILQNMGLNVQDPHEVARFASMISVSGCPYPAPNMLFAYDDRKANFSDRIIAVVDAQREKRQKIESDKSLGQETRLNKGQNNARNIAFFSILLGGGLSLLHAPTIVCMTIIIMGVGGPNAATVASRFLDKWRT